MWKRLLALVSAIVFVGMTAGCGLSSGPGSSALVIYTSRPKVIADGVVESFEKVYPEYEGRVRMLTLGAGEVVERIRAESYRPQADVWWGGTSQQFGMGVDGGLLEPMPQDVVDRVPERFRGPEGKWVGEMQMAQLFFYNNNVLDETTAPKDWDDLSSPDLRNQFLIRDVAASGTMRSVYSALIGRDFEEEGADPGYEYLKALDRNTKDYAANPSDLYLRVQRQEAPLSIWNLQDVLVQASNGAPFTPVVPESGAPMLLDGVGKVADAPHGDVADEFLEFLLRQESQQTLADESFQLPTVPLLEEPQWLADIDLKEMPVDWDLVNDHETEWMTHWVQQIKNRG